MAADDNGRAALYSLFKTGKRRKYASGEIVLRAGDEPQGVYLITKGFVKVYTLSKRGEERVHLFYGEDDVFPVMWAYKDAVRNVYYTALAPTELLLVPREEFRSFVANHPKVADYLLEEIVGLFRLYAGRIDNLSKPNSYDRTAYRIVSLANRFGMRGKDGSYVIVAPVTHQEIANSINLSRETTSRAMERLQRQGLIAYDDERHIVVKDMHRLIEIQGEDEIEALWPRLVHETR